MDELAKLEHLSLVSRVVTELENHFGDEVANKDVAEFIIGRNIHLFALRFGCTQSFLDLAKKAGTFDKFKTSLAQIDPDGVSYFKEVLF